MTAPPAAQVTVPPTPRREPEAEAGTRHQPHGQPGLGRVWRATRLPLALIVLFALGIYLAALLAPSPKSNIYLDPADSSATGAQALATILSERGFDVISAYSPAAALAAAGPARSGTARSGPARSGPAAVTLMITSPDLLTSAQRRQLARADADLVLVQPGAMSLRTLAPAVLVANPAAPAGVAIAPSCGLTGATLAGPATAGGITYRIPGYATGCYPRQGNPSVVRYTSAGRTITIVGSGLAWSNGFLGREGNAALALNLLNAHATIVWLTPEPTVATLPPPSTAPRSGPALVPGAAWLVVLQLLVALLLAALWRARRFGPLITERLPVVVRASETVEGHARLYQARRSRDRAAAALREAMLSRIKPAIGLPPDADSEAVIDALASRSALPRPEVTTISYGPPPASDAELISLANDLDELEREVRSR
jgi:hypothetical protein